MKKKSYLKYIVSSLLFGLNGIVASNINLSSYNIVLLRTLIGSSFLIVLFFITRQKITFIKNYKDLRFIVISGIAMGASWMFLYEAYSQIGVSIASLIYYTGPVIVMILSPILFHEKLTITKSVGFIAVLAGIILVNGNVFDGNSNLYGIVCGLLSAVTYSIMVMSNKKSKSIIGMENSVLQMIFGFFTVAVFVLFKTGFVLNIEPVDWKWILILGLINTGLGCYFYFSSIGDLPVQSVAIFGYLEPLSAVILSVIFLHEVMSTVQIIGAVLIIGGAVFGECCHKKRKVLN